MSTPVIEAKGLTKRYGRRSPSMAFPSAIGEGEIFGLLGPNGAGKTTTILMLLGLSDISGGEARVFGHDPAREPLAVKRRVGYLPDSVGFYDHLTAAENLHYTARLIGIPAAARKQTIADALDRVGLDEVAEKRVGTFSHGMRQRLALAEILMKDAESPFSTSRPTGSIRRRPRTARHDPRTQGDGVTILLSSHLLDRVQSVCDRVALFNAGKIALMGTVAELGRQVLGGGYAVEVEAQGGSDLARRFGACPACAASAKRSPAAGGCSRARRARGGGGAGRGCGRPADAALARPAEPGGHLQPLLPDTRGGAPCGVKAPLSTASASCS